MYKGELCGCRECARAFLSSLLDASERGEGGFERNARKRTGRAVSVRVGRSGRSVASVGSVRSVGRRIFNFKEKIGTCLQGTEI